MLNKNSDDSPLKETLLTDIGRPFFSILTATLNSAKLLVDNLESIKKQTFTNYEHIIIDGGSTDGTMDLLKRYQHENNIIYISEKDEGIADALNKGLKIAHGQYILVLQADDQFLDSGALEKVHSLIKIDPMDFHIFPIIFDHPLKGRVLLRPIPFLWWNHFKFIFCHQGCLTNRRVFHAIGNFDNAYHFTFDYDFFYRSVNQGCKLRFQKIPFSLMGGHGISSTPSLLFDRLREESLIQQKNEHNPCWRISQILFRMLYIPYKKATIYIRKP